MSKSENIKQLIAVLPDKPGVYQYFDKNGQIIYVGKAKNLKKRVNSYFTKNFDNYKTKILVSHIADIKFVVVDTELDALLLENNLIKTYQPKYNIQLKDDKTYPWIVVKKEPFPRVFPTRQKRNDGSKYFGPYPNVKVMQSLLDLIREMYPLRTCSLDLSQNKIQQGKYKACLEYHIGRCKAPCVSLQTPEEYQVFIEQIEFLLKGKTYQLIQTLKARMLDFAANYAFEQAQEMKELIAQLEKYRAKSTIVSSSISDVDVLTFETVNNRFFFNYLVIQEGSIVHAYTNEVVLKLQESSAEVLSVVLPQIRERFGSNSKEVLVEQEIGLALPGINWVVPQIGDKKKLVELSQRNVQYYRLDKLKKEALKKEEKGPERILLQIQKDFRLSEIPYHIECFDNSNFQGTNAVSACVVFKNAQPSKKDYRHFNVKTVEGPDDFATMKEVVFRRYKRLVEEGESLPQLIVIDGGKGQLGAACDALKELGIYGQLAIVGIAKRLEEIFFPGDQYPIYLDKRSESLKVIQYLRNEAHRFGITHHRNKRSKSTFQTQFDQIPGIGPKTIALLYQTFGSVEDMQKAEYERLIEVIDKTKAEKLIGFFKQQKNSYY
jgi:excinuclease ABC subunit C